MANEQSDKSSTRQITVLASCSREQLDAWREEAFAGNKTAINRLHYWATCATPETTRARSSIATCPCGDILAIQEKKCDRADCPVVAKSPSATALSEPWPIKLPVTYSERHHCIIGADGINVFALHLRMSVVDGHAIARIINREQFDIGHTGQR